MQSKLQFLISSLPVKPLFEHMHSTKSAFKQQGVTVKLKFYLKNKHTTQYPALFSVSLALFCAFMG